MIRRWPRPILHDLAPGTASFAADVRAGLAARPKRLPCKYFYDEEGSRLFERICELPEYYPTRAETALLADIAGEIAELAGPHARVIELGSGASHKVRLLLDALDRPAAYLPVDISREALIEAAERIAAAYPAIRVTAICADYTRPFAVPAVAAPPGRPLAFFPGSTIGNFPPTEARRFLALCARLLGRDGSMVIGVDLKKDRAVLEAAYNDAAGVTAAFNLNLLARINRELGGDFDLPAFGHRAFYDAAIGRIEMHLVSRRAQRVRIGGDEFAFATGETIHTEDSYKYAPVEFQALAQAAGWQPRRVWTGAGLFSLHYLVRAD